MNKTNLVLLILFIICLSGLFVVTRYMVNHPIRSTHSTVQYKVFYEYNVYNSDTIAIDTVYEIQPR